MTDGGIGMYLKKSLIKVLAVLLAAVMLASCAAPVVKKVEGSRLAAIGMFGDGKWPEAEIEATRAIDGLVGSRREMNASLFDCKWLTSSCVVQEGQAKQANEEYARDIARMQALRAVARFELHNYSGARADAEAALEVLPEHGIARYVLIREFDRVGDKNAVQREISRLERSPEQFSRNMAQLIKTHYRSATPGDWTHTVAEIRRFTLQIAQQQGWGATTLRAMIVSEEAGPDDGAYAYEVTMPSGWEELKDAVPLVNQAIKRVNPIRDYDDVGASINVAPMQALLGSEKADLTKYRAAFIKNLQAMKYDTTTIRPYPALEQPGRQTAFWIGGVKHPARELVIIRANGPYAEIVAVVVMRSYDDLLQRYLGDVNKMLDSISIEKVRPLSFAERLKSGKPMSELDRFRAQQESHFSITVKAPENWRAVPSFEEGKWNTLLRVNGDINISGALRVYMLEPEFGYSREKYPEMWDFIASKFAVTGPSIPLQSFTALHLPRDWQARITDMPYDPGRSLLIAKRQGKYVLVYSFMLIQAIANHKDRTPAGFEAAAAKNKLFRKYRKDIEYFVSHTQFKIR